MVIVKDSIQVRISWNLGQSQTIEISKIGSNSVNFGPIEKSKVTVISRGVEQRDGNVRLKIYFNHYSFDH